MKILKCMDTSCDGAHCGLADWYPAIEKGIKNALTKDSWTTGWYSSKKEIASAKITKENGNITVEVSVSDDFDTEGYAITLVKNNATIEEIRDAIYLTWDNAEKDRKSRRDYKGWSIGHTKDGKRVDWIETYIQDVSGWDMPNPPGDNYGEWGFQYDTEELTDATRKKIENAILSGEKTSYRIGKYMVDSWDKGEI